MTKPSSYYKKAKDYLFYSILRVDDTPHRLALGLAIGMFVALTPTIPLQMILTITLSILLKANRLVGLPMVWVSNPLTIVPVYYPQYLFGCHLTGVNPGNVDFYILVEATRLPFKEAFLSVSKLMAEIAFPLFVGSLIVSIIFGVITYLFFFYLIIWYRRKFTYAPTPLEPKTDHLTSGQQ